MFYSNSSELKINRRLFGSLFYLTLIRSDITYSVRFLSQLMENPKDRHLNATYMVLTYIKGTLEQVLFYLNSFELKLNAKSEND